MFQAQSKILTKEAISLFATDLMEQEKSVSTIKQYTRDLSKVAESFHGEELTKSALVNCLRVKSS